MAQEFAFAAPSTEEMTKTVTGIVGAGAAGVVEGTVVAFSKKMGALEPILSWGALLGVPALGIAGALFTKGMLGNISQGVAAGGVAILGYSLPAMLAPEMFARKTSQLTAEQRALLASGSNIKLLPAAAAAAAAEAARRGVKSSVEF